MSTKVRNPATRGNGARWSTCAGCGGKFTALGISRHWDKCPSPIMQALRAKAKEAAS